MEWLQFILENPEDNVSAFIVLTIVVMNLIYLFGQIIRAFTSMSKDNQTTIATENAIQSRLLDEISTRSDFERRLLDLHEKEVRVIKKEVSQILKILKAILLQLKAKGLLQ